MKKTHLVYDFADKWPQFQFILSPLLFVLVGIAAILFSKKAYLRYFGIFYTVIASLISIFVVPLMLYDYFHTRAVYKNNQYTTIEGKVENYHPMSESGGSDTEKFDVSGTHFEFSDFKVINGYNNAASTMVTDIHLEWKTTLFIIFHLNTLIILIIFPIQNKWVCLLRIAREVMSNELSRFVHGVF